MGTTELLLGQEDELQKDPIGETKHKTRDVIVTIPDHVYRVMERLAKQEGITISNVLSRALNWEEWKDEEPANGGQICLKQREVENRLGTRQNPDVGSVIRPPLRQGIREPILDKIEILDEAKYEEIMSQLRR